jgi:hypothetical protein
MINKVFWDIDETLIHTSLKPYNANAIHFKLGGENYYVKVRDCSNELIDFSRNLVGVENVYILTAATRDYAHKINDLAKWEFSLENIFTREDIFENNFLLAYDIPLPKEYKSNVDIISKDNVLIDNLPPRSNRDKIEFIGIDYDRYLKIDDYYGFGENNEEFSCQVKEFLLKLHT